MAFKLSSGIRNGFTRHTRKSTFYAKQTKNCITTSNDMNHIGPVHLLASFGCLCSVHLKTIDSNCRKSSFILLLYVFCVVWFVWWLYAIRLKWPFFIVLRNAHNHKFSFVFIRMKVTQKTVFPFCLQYRTSRHELWIKFNHALDVCILLFGRKKRKKKQKRNATGKCQQNPINIVKCSILRFRCERFFGCNQRLNAAHLPLHIHFRSIPKIVRNLFTAMRSIPFKQLNAHWCEALSLCTFLETR